MHRAERRLRAGQPGQRPRPSLGLYSPTASAKGITADLAWYENLTDVSAGCRPTSNYDGLVTDWQNAAGNQLRTEMMQAYAADQARTWGQV